MKKIMFLVILVLALSLPVFAQEFPDVPTDHWAYEAVQSLVDAGIIQGYPDGTFGGKRALTRYEFAEALAKAIPVIAEQVKGGEGIPGPKGETGATGPAGPQGPAGPGVSPDQLAALQRMANEFRDELAALGVDVDQLKRDVASLQERVTNIENEQKRVVLTGEVNFIGRGEVRNTAVQPFDRDNRALAPGAFDSNSNNPLANSAFLTDYQFGIKGRVSDNVNVNGIIAAGNYLPEFAGVASDDFTLWNMYMDAGVNLGPLGKTDLVVGRFPFQLTPLTLKFVDPDSYTNIGKLDNGDFVLDGGSASFNIGKLGMTVFAAKAANEAELGDLITPDLMLSDFGFDTGYEPYQGGSDPSEVAQLAGARVVIGTPLNGNLGLTYYQTGQNIPATAQIMGADLNASIGKIGIAGEFAKSDPNDSLENAVTGNGDTIGNDNTAWNAGLSYQFGNLGIGGGYTNVEANYFAPGYWSRAGEAVNLANVKGATANLNYAFSKRISLAGNAMFLQPDKDSASVVARSATTQGAGFVDLPGSIVDKITSWKAGLKYGLTSANSVDLGWEEVNWQPISGNDTKERYISLGLGHSFNPNSSLKLLYQIVSYEQGSLSPYGDSADFRGGVATAQFQLKY